MLKSIKVMCIVLTWLATNLTCAAPQPEVRVDYKCKKQLVNRASALRWAISAALTVGNTARVGN